MRKFLLTLAVLCGTVSAWAQTSLRISEGLLATQENTQYKWTSAELTAPTEGEFNKIRITFLKTSNNEKPAGFPCVALAEFYLYDKDGNAVALTEDRFSSNATHVGEGSIAELCDGTTTQQDGEGANDWYWHSQWSGTPSPYGYHYLEINVAELEADLSKYQIGWVTRRAQASPADVIISTGATTEEAAKNANSQMLPKVSTEIAKIYTIKSVRSKNFLAYDETNAKPQQTNTLINNCYWYFTQGTDGKVVMHNAVSGKVLGTNFEMATEGEWYVSPAEYRPGVVFSKTANISQNNCIDDQNGSIGSWSHNSGDNEGTTWLVEEVTNASINVPALSLKNMKISSIGAAVTEIKVNKWYILNNVGRGNYVSQEGNNWKMRATGNVVAGDMAEDKAGYLFKITKNGDYYNIMSGNGKYFQLGENTASTSATPVNFQIDVISGDNFCLYDKDHGYAADGQETGYNFVGWSTSVPTNAGGNDSYRILPVELFDLGEIAVLKSELSDAITKAQNMYNNIKSYIGEGVGKYTAPADIETQFEAIVAFCEGIDENTTLDAINAKMAELETLVASVQLNMPVAGKFYRMHNDNKYITSSVTDDGKIALSETNNDAASVYYYDDTHLLAYNTGLYMGLNKDDWTFEAVGSTDISAIQFVAAVNGAVAKYNIKSADRWLHRTNNYVNRCTYNTCGDAHNWTIEEVTELPLTIHSSGYSTFSVPVDVEIPTEVTAYYAESQDGENVKMLSIDSKIPANTGVVIKGEGTVNFTITSDATALDNNLLKPVIAAKAVTAEKDNQVFILTTVGKDTGFYPLSATSNTIGGHKSYLEIPATSSARLNIVWNETVTGIDSIEGIEKTQNAESIYNLAGQKLLKVQKGINIINGKLIVK